METQAQKYFINNEQMSEQQVCDLLETAKDKRDFDIVDALEEERERRGVVLDDI